MPDQVDWRAVEREASPGRAVGRLLRDQREALGLSLSDVAQRLRIRRPYIEAIEAGRFDELPGAAYIPAFLRAYAVHLGLDPVKVLAAYHSAGIAVPIERPVALPADFPLAEKRAPYGLAVLTVLMVIAAGYTAWNFLPRESQVVAQKVPPVPDRLLASRPAEPAPAAVAPPAATPAAEVRPADTRPADIRPVESRPVDTRPVDSRQVQTPPAAMWPLPKTEPAAPTVVAAPPIAVPVAAPPPPVQPVQLAPAATIGQAQAAQPPQFEPRVDVLRGGQPGAVEAQEARSTNPELPRTELSLPVNRDTPISVRVDSWVELRAPNGDVLAQTYLRAGESYTIPTGIAFRVINAR